MRFESPWLLLGLALIPLALLVYLRHERRAARARDAFALAPVRPSVAPRGAGWRRHGPIVLYGLALAALVAALARPEVTVAVPVEQAAVVLAVDHSGSMEATDVAPNRLAAALAAAERFLDEVPRDVRVGAVSFNHLVQALQSPTRDHEAVRAALRAVRPAGSTATGDALEAALKAARQPLRRGAKPPPAAIVLLSDGKSVRGRDPVAVAHEAAAAKIPIYTVALGTPDGTIQVPSGSGGTRAEPVPPDPQTLQRVAEVSGGRAFTARDAGRLGEVFENLGSQVARERRPREVTAAFAGGALLLIVGAAAASLRWFGRVP